MTWLVLCLSCSCDETWNNLSGKLSLLDELTSRKKSFSVDFANSDGDTLFHEITKLLPPATTPRLMEVTELLMKKGYR